MAGNPFDYVNAINSGKDIIRKSDDPTAAEKGYNSFMVNKALSYHIDTIMHAVEMNVSGELDNLLQNDYYLNSVRPKKRFAKWAKVDKAEDCLAVQQYYECSLPRAKEYLRLLTPEQLKVIKDKLNLGGSNRDVK